MKQSKTSTLKCVAMMMAGTVLLAGCSGSTEDVRIALCKELAVTFIDLPQTLEWPSPA